MFNLTVDTAHTFYVGQDGWLVHNVSNKYGFELQSVTGMANDFAGKGFHLNSTKLGEVKISFVGEDMVARNLDGIALSSRETNALKIFLQENSTSVINQLERALQHTAPIIAKDGTIIQTLSGTNLRNLNLSRSGGTALIEALKNGCL